MNTAWAHASEIAAAVSDGRTSAAAVARAALARIADHDRVLNAFTALTEERALAEAAAIDAARANGRRLGALV
jgi:1-carboxybiuret hydrolase